MSSPEICSVILLSLARSLSQHQNSFTSVFSLSLLITRVSPPPHASLHTFLPSSLAFLFLPFPFPFSSPALPPQLKFSGYRVKLFLCIIGVTPPPSFSILSLVLSLSLAAVMSVQNIDVLGRRLFRSLASSHVDPSHLSVFFLPLRLTPNLRPHTLPCECLNREQKLCNSQNVNVHKDLTCKIGVRTFNICRRSFLFFFFPFHQSFLYR